MTAAVRGMTTTESAETLTLYQLVMLTALFALFLPAGWITPTPLDAAWMLFNGVANAVGQYWWTRALHLAPASAVAPFFYLSLVWASILGFAIWGDVPTIGLAIGSAIVVASGLFLLWRERNRRMVAKRPEDRFASMAEVEAALAALEEPSASTGSTAIKPEADSKLTTFMRSLSKMRGGKAPASATAQKKPPPATAEPDALAHTVSMSSPNLTPLTEVSVLACVLGGRSGLTRRATGAGLPTVFDTSARACNSASLSTLNRNTPVSRA